MGTDSVRRKFFDILSLKKRKGIHLAVGVRQRRVALVGLTTQRLTAHTMYVLFKQEKSLILMLSGATV